MSRSLIRLPPRGARQARSTDKGVEHNDERKSMMAISDAAARGDAGAAGPAPPPEAYVLLHNVSKRHNVGNLARNCVAFGVRCVRRRTRRTGPRATRETPARERD